MTILPTVLALANDVSYDSVFEEQMKEFFQAGRSGSGNFRKRELRERVKGDRICTGKGWAGHRILRFFRGQIGQSG